MVTVCLLCGQSGTMTVRMYKNLKRVLILAAGCVFVPLGVAGIALPFLQGFLFLAIGLILLSIGSDTIRAWIERYTRKYPRVHAFIEKLEAWITSYIGRP